MPFEKSAEEQEYDNFILNQLPRGAAVGTFLHSLFEELDFTSPDNYGDVVSRISESYSSYIKEEFAGQLLQMVDHVMNVTINTGAGNIKLGDVIPESSRAEMEFYFSIDEFRREEVRALFPQVEVASSKTLRGRSRGGYG